MRPLFSLMAAATLASAAPTTPAATLHVEYHAGPTTANSTPAKVWSPELWGWLDLHAGAIGPAGAGVVNSGGSGLNAWRVADQSSSSPNPIYVADFLPQDLTRVAAEGWRMRSVIRYVDDFGGERNLGMSAFLGGRAYHMMLDLTTTGDLRATLYDETPRTFQLTTGGAGAAAFHRFQFLNVPGSAAVAFAVDGVIRDQTWDGIPLAGHASNVQWGNSDQALSGRGIADYQEATFEIGPFTEAVGDFDGNGTTDGNDYLWWQRDAGRTLDQIADANGDGRVDAIDLAIWRSNFGAVSSAGGGATQLIPEPAAGAWLAAFVPWFARRKSRTGSGCGAPHGKGATLC
ncbi:MAG: hypothetical protein JNL18_04625 [Planctomycetaceae bacterium]|nr:hypothetical protein [Planctomycetaceae bacterium]